MANTIVDGGDLMIFVDGHSVALAKSHTLQISSDSEEVSTKDVGAGLWKSQDVKSLSWQVTSENLVSSSSNYDALFEKMVAKEPVTIVFASKSEEDLNAPLGGWTPKASTGYTGKAIITSLEIKASVGEKASFSCTFQGSGELKKVGA